MIQNVNIQFACYNIIEESILQAMISKLFQHKALTKLQKTKFIPFVNERDFMGTLIRTNHKTKNNNPQTLKTKNLALIQNLKKTTKQYFFEKKYQKMVQKLKRNEQSMEEKEYDYQHQINKCFKIIQASNYFTKKKDSNQNNKNYVQLMDELHQEINSFKENLVHQIRQPVSRCNTKKNPTCQLEEKFDVNELRKTLAHDASFQRHLTTEKKKINQQKFKSGGKNAQLMVNFSNQASKYKHLVQNKRLNPWRKWYVIEHIQIFPGKKIQVKKLHKTIY